MVRELAAWQAELQDSCECIKWVHLADAEEDTDILCKDQRACWMLTCQGIHGPFRKTRVC